MAIQNFLSGGYYGKLGATVGQRWKNKRTIRTYVKPANPRTEVQQANRNKFANAVTFAQMGMQMNYYATLFVDPNFTHWNYRMKVARELKNNGLTGLDLIPLYPTSFVPPTLITEITKDTVTGRKHISFAVPSLSGNADRVLSLMFALYDAKNNYLGLKLYIGYYYASNPGYLEVDVDDIDEINEHCFVRMVSNDDVDSTTDLIASPSLQIKTLSIDIRDFNTDIVSVKKTNSAIDVTFAELWKDVPTVNAITVTAHFISNGASTSATATAAALANNNGYCSVSIPFAADTNQQLPAFPSGSDIVISSVDYEGATWQYTKENDTKSYSDADLTRNITALPSWDSSYAYDINFSIAFGGTVASETKNFNMVCSGRWDLRSEESQSFNVVGNGTNLVFTCTGNRKAYPMQSGDYIALTAQSFVCNGVTYQLAAQNINLRNGITSSPLLTTLNCWFGSDGLQGNNPTELLSLYMAFNLTGYATSIKNFDWSAISLIEITPQMKYCNPTSGEAIVEEYGGEYTLIITDYYESSTNRESLTFSKEVTMVYNPITHNGITYPLSGSWAVKHWPATLGNWPRE